MNNSIQPSASSNAVAETSKTSSKEFSNNPSSSEDGDDFTTALASAESTQESEQNSSETAPDVKEDANHLVGNSLPAEDGVIWQELLLTQTDNLSEQQPLVGQAAILLATENRTASLSNPKSQSLQLLEGKAKPFINPDFYKQDYFNVLSMQNKDTAASLPAGLSANNMNMQLAAAHFTPQSNESIMMNMLDQAQPTQVVNTTLSQSLAAVGLGTATQAAATQTQMAPLNIGQNAWETNLGSRLQMMVGQNVQAAEIRLDPPELGTLEIKIKIANDVATVSITSANAQVRDALENSIPKLREMFSESGVELGDVNVKQESFAQQQNSGEESNGNAGFTTESEQSDAIKTVSSKIINDNLLDIYA